MKRLICVFIAAVFVLSFAACGKEDGIDYLVLVNKENKLPDDWEAKLETVHVTNSLGDDVEVEKKAYDAYLKLKEALEAEDVRVDLDSARRSVAEQQRIWDDFTEKYGEVYTKRTVAVPGYSEHHTGLALDLYLNIDGEDVYYNEDMVEYPEIWAKIHEKLAEFGFILRYLEGKEAITGYGYEPWHIRYVDSPETAKEITDKGVTLEEYLDRLPVGNVAPPADTEEPADTTAPADTGSPFVTLNDFAGKYVSGDSEASVASDGADAARITIEWSDTHISDKRWEIEGVFDPDTLTVEYDKCAVSEITYNADGSEDVEEIFSGSCSGSVVFNGADRSFTWNDERMDEKNIIFTWSEN